MFATTTVIDFAPIFRRPALADLAVEVLLEWSLKTHARLHAFVVMHHHLYLAVGLSMDWSGSAWMQQLKTRLSHRLGPMLDEDDRRALADQVGLNDRAIWKRSFRSMRISTPKIFWQKIRYVHLNPIRAGYCEWETDYLWSSKRYWEAGLWDEVSGLDKEAILWKRS